MSLLVVGSIAIDDVETPKGTAPNVLGGSASYFSYAASFFTPVRVVGVVGADFPSDLLSVLTDNPNIDTQGVQKESGNSFRWKGKYEGDMNVAETLEVHLNVFGEFDPHVPAAYRDSRFVFLANGSPNVQMKVLDQMDRPELVVADTMNLWIEIQRDELLTLMKRIDGLVLNDQEALLLTQADSVVAAGLQVMQMGPKFVIVKKGEHGAMFFAHDEVVAMPAFPTGRLTDPTGAGDSFAGGMMGYLASQGKSDVNTLKRGMAYGAVVASINVEGFTLSRFLETSRDHIDKRFDAYRRMLHIV